MTDIGQRPGWATAIGDVGSPARSYLTGTLASYRESVSKRLRAAGASRFPATIVHGDFIAQNLLFQSEALSGILDFDCAHLNVGAADVACARRSRNDDLVRGYLEVVPLTAAELECLDDLWRATVLRYAVQIQSGDVLVENQESEVQWCSMSACWCRFPERVGRAAVLSPRARRGSGVWNRSFHVRPAGR